MVEGILSPSLTEDWEPALELWLGPWALLTSSALALLLPPAWT